MRHTDGLLDGLLLEQGMVYGGVCRDVPCCAVPHVGLGQHLCRQRTSGPDTYTHSSSSSRPGVRANCAPHHTRARHCTEAKHAHACMVGICSKEGSLRLAGIAPWQPKGGRASKAAPQPDFFAHKFRCARKHTGQRALTHKKRERMSGAHLHRHGVFQHVTRSVAAGWLKKPRWLDAAKVGPNPPTFCLFNTLSRCILPQACPHTKFHTHPPASLLRRAQVVPPTAKFKGRQPVDIKFPEDHLMSVSTVVCVRVCGWRASASKCATAG